MSTHVYHPPRALPARLATTISPQTTFLRLRPHHHTTSAPLFCRVKCLALDLVYRYHIMRAINIHCRIYATGSFSTIIVIPIILLQWNEFNNRWNLSDDYFLLVSFRETAIRNLFYSVFITFFDHHRLSETLHNVYRFLQDFMLEITARIVVLRWRKILIFKIVPVVYHLVVFNLIVLATHFIN